MVQKYYQRRVLACLVTAALTVLTRAPSADAQSITEFPIPSPASGNQPIAGVAAGSDGALWFTDGNGNRIIRITTAGTFTAFSLPTPSSNPEEITADPTARCGSPSLAQTRSGGSPQPARSPSMRSRLPGVSRLASRQGRTARCGSPKESATRSGV